MQAFPGGRPYHSLTEYLRNRLGQRIQKVSVDGGFTCPNRDGSKGIGGCTFCSNAAFNPSYCAKTKSIFTQIEDGIEFHARRYRKAEQFLVYFQPYSNTYAPIGQLEMMFKEALSHPKVAGISISTRPDCFTEDTALLLNRLAQKHLVFLELGIESIHDVTLRRINRGHNYQCTQTAFALARKYELFTTGHYILGLPGESREQMLLDTHELNQLPMNAIKLHQLQIVKGTMMEKDYLIHPQEYHLFELPEYTRFLVQFVSRLRPDLLIDRFAGEVPPAHLVAPDWGMIRYDGVLRLIEAQFQIEKSYQGMLWQ